MMDASLYFDGEVQVPLSQFSSENPESRYEIKISNMAELLQNSECALEGYCRSKTRDKILRGLNCTPDEWRGMESGPLNAQLCQELCFVAESASISSAKTTLGDDFLCTVRLHCTPPKQLVKLTDGEIFQNVRFYYKNDRAAAAQEWIKSLSGPKQANLISLLGCPAIMDALDRLLRFPGLWFGLQLGNWAKHLAAHVDQCIVNYLSHIYNFYSTILDGFESMSDQLDEITIAQLQHRSPSWSSQDIAYIEKGFRSGTLFPGIRSSHVRNTVKERIKAFTGIIPSIITFHENMKYLTIGTKILERCIELPRQVEIRRGSRVRPDLFNKLKAHWNLDEMKVQADHNAFISSPLPPDADLCCIQLVIAAIRHFASLNVYEAPLMDSNRKTMSATVDSETQGHLCWIATKLGFNDQRIQAQASERNPASWPDKSQKPLHTWRAGKPFREVFLYLEQHSFLLQIIQELNATSKTPSPLCVQGDILSAFFNLGQYVDSFGGIESDQQPPGGPSFHAKDSFEAFLKLRAQNTTITKKDTEKDSRFDKSEPGSSKSHKDKSPPLNPQVIGQEQRNGSFQFTFTGLGKDTNERAVQPKPIRRLKSQRQPTLRTASLDSTVSGVFFNQQKQKEQHIKTSNASPEEEDLYATTPRNASPSNSSDEKAGDIFTRHARLASVSTDASVFVIDQQENTKQSIKTLNTSSQEDPYDVTPPDASPFNSSKDRAIDVFPRRARLASVLTNSSGIGIIQQGNTKQKNKRSSSSPQEHLYGTTPPDASTSHSSNDEAEDEPTKRLALVSSNTPGISMDQQENTNQSTKTTSISSLGDSYYATPRGSAASSIKANPRKDSNSAELPTSTIHAYNNRTASIESIVSGIEISRLENTEESVRRPDISSQYGSYNAASRNYVASIIHAHPGEDENSTGLSSLKQVFQDNTSKNSSDKKVEYPSLHSPELLLQGNTVSNVQHTEESSDTNLKDTQVSKIQSPSIRSPKSGKYKAEIKPFNSPISISEINAKLNLVKAKASEIEKSVIKKGTRSEVKGSPAYAGRKQQLFTLVDPQDTRNEGSSASILSELQTGYVQYPNVDDAKAKLPSTSAGLFNEFGFEKFSYDPKRPLPRLSVNLEELQAGGHQYNKVAESSQDPPPPPPQSSSTAEPQRQRHPRPAPIYVKQRHNAKVKLQRPNSDSKSLENQDVDSNSTSRPKERHSYDDSGSEMVNRDPRFPPEKIQLLKDHSPRAIYGKRLFERLFNDVLQHKSPQNTLRPPLSAPLPLRKKHFSWSKDLAYEYPLSGWHRIRDELFKQIRHESSKTKKPERGGDTPEKVQILNGRSLLARYSNIEDTLNHSKGIIPVNQIDDPKVDQTDDPKVDQTDDPKVDQTDDPKVDQTDDPKVDQTDNPKVDQTDDPKVDQTDDPNVDQMDEPTVSSNRTSGTESVDFAELSPYNMNRNVGSGIFNVSLATNPIANSNIPSSQDNYHRDRSTSPPFNYTDIY